MTTCAYDNQAAPRGGWRFPPPQPNSFTGRQRTTEWRKFMEWEVEPVIADFWKRDKCPATSYVEVQGTRPARKVNQTPRNFADIRFVKPLRGDPQGWLSASNPCR